MTTTATTTAVTKGNKVLSQTDQVATILAKHDAKKDVTAPLLNSNDVRRSNKEVIAQEIAKEQAKPKRTTKPAIKPATTKEAPEEFDVDKNAEGVKQHDKKAKTPSKVKPVMITRIQCVGIIMRQNPEASKEVICNKADSLFIKKTNLSSNIRETETQYSKAINFMKGYNE